MKPVNHQPRKTMKQNESFLLSLVCDQIKTIEVTFQEGGQHYTYMTVIPGLKVLDDVIVEAGQDLKVATVAAVHDEAEIDPKSPYKYKWAVSTSGSKARDSQRYLHEMEAEAMKQIKAAKKRAAKKRLAAELGEMFGSELDAVKAIDFNPELD
jgi:hypothetical protein